MFDFSESDSQRSSLKKNEHFIKPIIREKVYRTSAKSKRGEQLSKNSEMEIIEGDGQINQNVENSYLMTIDDLKRKVLSLEEQLLD